MTFPFADDVVSLCALLSQYASESDVRAALMADAEVMKFTLPPSEESEPANPLAVPSDSRVVMVSELLHTEEQLPLQAEQANRPVQVLVTSNTEDLLHLLTNRCFPTGQTEKRSSSPSASRIPLSIIFISRKQKLDLLGHPLKLTYNTQLTVKDVCILSVDVTQPLVVLQQLLEKIYEPVFRNGRTPFGIRGQIHDLIIGIQLLQKPLPDIRIRDYVEEELLVLCDEYPRLDPPQLMERMGSQATDSGYLRLVREARDRCVAVLQIEPLLTRHMQMDSSKAKAALFGQEIDPVVTEKILQWEGIRKWLVEVQKQLRRREWSLTHQLLRKTVDTNFEREFEQHQAFVVKIIRFLKSIPSVRLETADPVKFYDLADSIYEAVRTGVERAEKLSISVLNEITVELLSRWVVVALNKDVVLFRMPSKDDTESEVLVARSLSALQKTIDVLQWVQRKYKETYKLLLPRVPSHADVPSHAQVDALFLRCRSVQSFIELHTLRIQQLEKVFVSTAKFSTGMDALSTEATGEAFVRELRCLYSNLVEEVAGSDVGVTVLWGTSSRSKELFDKSITRYSTQLASIDERLAQYVSDLLSYQYTQQNTSSHSTQFLWSFIRFRFLPMEKVKAVLRGYQQAVEEQLVQLALRHREDYFNVELSKRKERFALSQYGVSKAAAGVIWERYFAQSFRQCYETRDYLTENGWHQLLSLRNMSHYWRLNDTLADALGFPIDSLAAELQLGCEVAGCAYALAFLQELFPNEEGWKADPHIHSAMELVQKEENKSIYTAAHNTLILLGCQKLRRVDVAKTRDLQTMHETVQHAMEQKIFKWMLQAMEQVRTVPLNPREYTLTGPIFTVAEVTHREGALARRQRGIDAEPRSSIESSVYQIEVAFPYFYQTLAADVRYMESTSPPSGPEADTFRALHYFVHRNERRFQIAVCLAELLRVYYATVNGEDDTISLLATDPYKEVNDLFQRGFQLDWSDEANVLGYVNQLTQKLPSLTFTAQEVRAKSESVYGKVHRLGSQPYHPEAIAQTVNEMLTITTALSMECLHARAWVQRVQPLLDAALISQLRFLLHGWTTDFLSMRDDLRFLEQNVETEVFHLRPLRVQMIVVFKEVRLETSAPVWRQHWLQKLDEYFRWINNLPRLYLEEETNVMDLKEVEEARKGYKHLLHLLPPFAIEEPLKAIDKCIQEAIFAEHEWRSSQQFLNIDVNVMHQRFGNDLRRWSTAIQLMNKVTTQLMDFTQPNKLLGGIVIGAEGVQNELSRKFDQVSHFALSKFQNVLEQELQSASSRMKDEFAKAEALKVINDTNDAIEFLCEVPRIKAEMADQEDLVNLLLESEATLHKLGKAFPDNWMHASKVQEEYRSLKDLIDRKMKALHIRRPLLLEAANSLAEALEKSTENVKGQLEDIDKHPGRTPMVVQQIVSEVFSACAALRTEAERVNRIHEALGIPRVVTRRIEHMQAEVNTLKEVWTRATQVASKFVELGKTPFFELQPQWLQDELQQMESDLESFPVSLKTYRVYQELLEKVKSASALRRYVFDLRSDAMAPLERAQRHWIVLKQRLNTTWVLDRLTVSDIWSSDPLTYSAVYNDVLEVAQGERRIEQQLSHISTFWESFQFSVTIYKKQTCLVRGWDTLFDKLADDLGTCAGMRSSPFFNSPPLISTANEVEGRLNHLRQVMETLVEVQKHWVYLDGIFTGNHEIRLQLPHDTVQFERTTRELMTILPRPRAGSVTPEVGVQFFLQDEKLSQTLHRMLSQINAVQHALTAYLDSQRQRFPRFFFVGDDDLLEIMGNGTDPAFMSRHLRKMFTALAAFVIEENTNRLKGFSSVEGEVVQYLGEPLEVHQRAMYDWLLEAEAGMMLALRTRTSEASGELFQANEVTLTWMEKFPTQVLCLALQLWWVRIQEKQFTASNIKVSHRPVICAATPSAAPTSTITQSMDHLLVRLASNVLDTSLHTLMRHRCEQMITVAVYQRDVSRFLVLSNVQSVKDFEWSRVLRLYMKKDGATEQLLCCMADAQIVHGFEYTGCYERLVQTPLTDKCYFTLTQALHTRLGGSPVGPAGTGKTETVKALGMHLGRHVLVFNCDDTFDYQAVSRIFLGLCQVGAWGCFDEFNRLEERIMSALSLQIQLIQESLRRQQREVDLHSQPVPLNANVGIFITMNPGYAGRSNLPGNLKQLFRTVTMSVPDRETIAEVMLFAQGFHTAEHLSRKVVPLFRLCDSQFSKQAHYDFGLRALKSVLVTAGKQKRAAVGSKSPDELSHPSEASIRQEEAALMLSCIVENIAPKLVTQDVALFYPLLKDFFPEQRLPDNMGQDIYEAVQEVCAENGLTASPAWVEKICQLHSTKLGRHGLMMVGPSGAGKTMAWKVLMAATVRVDPRIEIHAYVLEPKVLSKTELFGSLDITTREWKDGAFSAVLRRLIESDHLKQEENSPKRMEHWIIFDGDVDPEWVENLNSVLDDNKILTLPNGERLALPTSVRIIFEVENLRYATPATVSRCGMLWFSEGVVPLACVLTYAYQQLEKKPIADARGRHLSFVLEEERIGLAEDLKRGKRGVTIHRGKPFNQYIAAATAPVSERETTGDGEEAMRRALVELGPGAAPVGGSGWRHEGGHPDARRIQSEILSTLGPAFGRHDIISKGIELMTSSTYRDHCIMELDTLQLLQGVFAILWEGVWRTFRCEQESGSPLLPHVLTRMAEKLMAYAVVWGLGAPMPYEHRERLASDLHLEATVSGGVWSILEVEVDYTTGEWKMVRDRVSEVKILAEQVGANETVIPTVDTARHQDILSSWIGSGRSAILCGPPGSGKTMSINSVLSRFPEYEAAFLNFSSGTTVDVILKSLEQYCTLRNTARGYVLSPSSDKKLLLFCDEINLPALDCYGTQTVLQLLRQLMECNGFFRARDNVWVHVEGVQIVGACNPPTDPGRIPLPHRFCRWAPVLFVDFPSHESLHIIYSTYCKAILHVNLNIMRQYSDRLAQAMVNVYLASQSQFTPMQKPHYLYSPRELSRWSRAIYEGIRTWEEAEQKSFEVDALVRLAVHEGLRVFSDRLVTREEREWTDFMMDDAFREQFPELPSSAYERPMLYSTLLSKEYTDSKREDLRVLIEQRIQTFCEEEVSVPLVVFDAMVDHIVRLDRVLRQPLGHMLMAGSSGVGKSMIARLAAWMRGYSVFWLKVHRDYDILAFEADLRALLRRSGCKGEKICFIFDESNIMQPSFLEYMNALLASGEVPGLFEGEEWMKLMQDIRDAVSVTKSSTSGKESSALPYLSTATDHDLYRWFLHNVKEKLHVVFTINPSSAEFANRAVASPALFNRCTIDWFGDWDRETLAQIAHARIAAEKLITDDGDRSFPSEEGAHEAVVAVLCAIHENTSQLNLSLRSRQANRGTFVTPRHFTDVVSHFVRLFREKCTGSSEQLQHLRNGLKKLDETSREIEQQRSQLKASEVIITESSRNAQEMLDRIVVETDTTKKEKEAAEELRCQLQEEEARIIHDKTVIESDLSRVEPALREAEAALNTVKPEYLREIRAYSTPPAMVKRVLEAVLTLMGERNSDDWDTLKGHIRREDFLSGVKEFKPAHISDAAQERVRAMMGDNLTVAAAYRASKAAGPLLQWVLAQIEYSLIYKKLRPMQKMVESLTKAHAEKLQALEATERDIEEKEAFLQKLKMEYQTTTEKIADLKHHTSLIAAKCERATTILGQLLDEQSRWEEEVQTYDTFSRTKVGDCVVSASFLAYIGFFDESVREKLLMPRWLSCLDIASIPFRQNPNVLLYLVTPSQHLEWQQHGLPTDQLCAENAMIMHRTERYPLLIDPTGAAALFLQSEYASQKISKASFSRAGYLKQLEMAVRFGYPIILEDAEFLDPAVTPLLNQEFRQNGGRRMTRVGAHDVDLSSSFKLFLLTRDPNYQPSPTLAGQTCIVNFTVTRSSLYSQCLHRIILHERPDMDAKRTALLKAQGEYQLRLRVLEQKLLTTIAEAEGSLLENDQLISTLASLKTDARTMQDDINSSGVAMQTIKGVENRYRPLAYIVSSTFFALKRFSELNSFYHYNVDFVFRVIQDALSALPAKVNGGLRSQHEDTDREETADSIAEELNRMKCLTSYVFNLLHRRAVRGMFMEDHLVLALRLAQMRSSVHSVIASAEQLAPSLATPFVDLKKVYGVSIQEEEWEWLLQTLRAPSSEALPSSTEAAAFPSVLAALGVLSVGKQRQRALAAVLQQPAFHTLRDSLSSPGHAADWEAFFASASPISQYQMLPADAFPPSTAAVRKAFLLTLILFYTRPDDFLAAALKTLQLFFDGADGSNDEQACSTPSAKGVHKFFSLQTHSVADALPELTSASPLLMVSDANYDPSIPVEQLARESGTMLRLAAMGSMESTTYAEKYVEEGIKTGCWVLLKNVHLAKSYVDQLEKYLHAHRLEGRVHSNFRLFLTAERSASRSEKGFLPVNLLEECVTVVFEPPPGIKSSMLQTYGMLEKMKSSIGASEKEGQSSAGTHRLCFAAAWVHAILTERLFYLPLGWSKAYEFSDAEFIRVVQAIEAWSTAALPGSSAPLEVDWVALRAIVAETVYGGKVSNPFDQLVIDIFCEKILNGSLWNQTSWLTHAESGTPPLPPLTPSMSRSSFMNWIAALPDGSSPPQWLGLPSSVSRVMLAQQALQALERLSTVQIALSDELAELKVAEEVSSPRASAGHVESIPSYMLQAKWSARLRVLCETWGPALKRLEERYTRHPLVDRSATSAMRNESGDQTRDPLTLSIERETEIGSLLVQRLWSDVSELDSIANGKRKPAALLRSLVEDVTRDTVPRRWSTLTTFSSTLSSLHPWMADIQARLEHVLELADAVVAKKLSRTPVHLGLLFSPGGLLTAFKQHYARERRLSLEQLVPRVRLSTSTSTSPLQDGALLFTGLTLYCAKVNESDGRAALLETSSTTVSALTHTVQLTWSWEKRTVGAEKGEVAVPQESLALRLRSQDARRNTIAVPLYASANRELLLDVVDVEVVPTSTNTVGLWYERGVCLTAWSPSD